ncbi:MAG: nucleotidyltransferase domain-containing protein [Candidatus Woesearchaeota archaeon]
MRTENKIVQLFIGEKKPKTIRQIAKTIGSDYKITHTAAKRLLDKKVLVSTTIGKSTLCEMNGSFYGIEICRAEDDRKKDLLKNKNLRQLYAEVMGKMQSAFFVFIVFGSFTKGKQTKNSDIDLLFISNDKDFEREILNMLSLIPLKTHALVFTEKDFVRMKDSKKPNIIHEVIEKNIILYGIENYYRLKNA